MNIQLTDKQKFDTQFIALRHFLNMAEKQEYFDWANQLLQADVFFHELAMIVSYESTDYSSLGIHKERILRECIETSFAQLGFNYHNSSYEIFDDYQAYDDLTYLYCYKTINKEINLIEGLKEITLLSEDNFAGMTNVWFSLSNRIAGEKDNPTYQAEILQTMKDYIRYYENGKIAEFYNERNVIKP